MDVFEAIRARHSVRAYSDQQVIRIDLENIVSAGGAAARAGRVQFVVVTRREALDAVQAAAKEAMLASGNDFLAARAGTPGFESLYDAPAAIAIAVPEGLDPASAEMAAVNVGAAAQNMMLAATGLGLSSCYTASSALAFASPEVRGACGVPEGMRVVAVVAIGVAADQGDAPVRGGTDAIWCE